MDVNAEAKRVMTLSLGKLYSSRAQRGGLRLHRSLLLSLVMRTARDVYLTAHRARESEGQRVTELPAPEERMDTSGAQVETPESQRSRAAAQLDSAPSADEDKGNPTLARDSEDKENRFPVSSSDRYARKRRGNASAEPDFLPSKKARMDSAEASPVNRSAGLRNCKGNSCRVGETFASVPLSPVVAAC